jgi:hypothetical protein
MNPSGSLPYTLVFSETTLDALLNYKAALAGGTAKPGRKLMRVLDGAETNLERMNAEDFLGALLATKRPQIFAESQVSGDGSDWTSRELALLGDINIAMRATIYDNGAWSPSEPAFRQHKPPFEAGLLFTPGALLTMNASPDYVEVTSGGRIDQNKYNALVERRLMPLLAYADQMAANEGMRAFVTLPGIGCGAFAGRFRGKMETHLESALGALLKKNGKTLRHIALVYFGPHDKGAVRNDKIHGISFRVRPSAGKPLLCAPQDYAEGGEDLSGCRLYKFVAWDHVSWPGNDFFTNSRYTDDGVSAAASNSMEIVTGI